MNTYHFKSGITTIKIQALPIAIGTEEEAVISFEEEFEGKIFKLISENNNVYH